MHLSNKTHKLIDMKYIQLPAELDLWHLKLIMIEWTIEKSIESSGGCHKKTPAHKWLNKNLLNNICSSHFNFN